MSKMILGVLLIALVTALSAVIVGPAWMWAVPVLCGLCMSQKVAQQA